MTRLRSSSFGEARPARARCIEAAAMTVAAVFIAGGTKLLACPMCFGAQESPLIDGAKLGVLVMLGVLLAVQGAFAYFFFYLRKRAKENADIELDLEWSELQRGSRPS
jgi:heme/copper-type cytochrome/quinol oxidase subunit 2